MTAKEAAAALHKAAGEVQVLSRRMNRNVSLGKHAQYVRAEFTEIDDELSRLIVELHRIANEIPYSPDCP